MAAAAVAAGRRERMNLDDITTLYVYNYWANHRLLTSAAYLTPEQFTAPSLHHSGSLRGILVHILDAEWGWRLLLQGEPSSPDMRETDFPTFETVRQRWEVEEQAMWRFLNALDESDLTRIVSYRAETGILRERLVWHCLYHVVNHGMQHRTEAAALLTCCGHSPGEMDFTMFLNERVR